MPRNVYPIDTETQFWANYVKSPGDSETQKRSFAPYYVTSANFSEKGLEMTPGVDSETEF